MICKNLSVTSSGKLLFAGTDLKALAQQYKTPLYVLDEERIRQMCRTYQSAMLEAFGENSLCCYASKALSFRQIYRIMKEENMGIDVVSVGEIYTAKTAGFDLSRALFHSNNKTEEDIRFAMQAGVGTFVADNQEEILALNEIAKELGICQKIYLRITPGIDPHTYEEVATGKVDSKFGFAIETGQALEAVKLALAQKNLHVAGLHCHVGSQVFDSQVFIMSAEKMLDFILLIRREQGYEIKELDLGGGYGVRYVESDPEYDLRTNILEVGAFIRAYCEKNGLSMPRILLEPGRSIVADAGLTLYTVGTVKQIPGYRNYVSVDGGMADNPRYALYRSSYTVLLPEKMHEEYNFPCSVVGRCCESGDILQEGVFLPSSVKRGDLLAVLTTGAYNFSMSSHYNRLLRPAVVMISDGKAKEVVRRENLEDLIRCDL